MSKSILVVDTPEYCAECPCSDDCTEICRKENQSHIIQAKQHILLDLTKVGIIALMKF